MKKILFSLSALFLIGTASAQTLGDVTNTGLMHLSVGIIPGQTSNIQIDPFVRNRVKEALTTTTGAILHFTQGNKTEDIYFSSATVNSVTKVTTLSGVIRDICPQYTDSIVSCGDGQSFGAGANVELTNDARLYNKKANIDRRNNYYGSGSNVCTGNQPCFVPNQVTTTERDALKNLSGAVIIWNSTLGVPQIYNPAQAQWMNFGSGSAVNATDITAGVSELGTIQDHYDQTIVGDVAPTVVQTKNLTMSGGLIYGGMAIILDSNGKINSSALFDYTSYSASGVVIKSASGAITTLTGASGAVATFDVNGNVIARQVEAPRTVCAITSNSADNNGGSYAAYNQTCTIPANSLSVGETVKIIWVVMINNITVSVKPKFAGFTVHTDTTSCSTGGSSNVRCRFEMIGTVRSIGASGNIVVSTTGYSNTAAATGVTNGAGTGTLTIDTTGTISVSAHSKKDSGGGSTNQLEQLIVIVNPAP